ncbi:MAG TPA: DUF4296 domain-containing protein [Saprospiraceae bacterium]|nr:DUF4296 domain-containing protein [Saprospiraceae bacterium]MCB9328508.1 DUF4296 domain-containing protein [Lewinellaceae bacterium]HPQ20785.1 DUF4296 domain-containing protein [Saprospiraceae bacterium]
MRNSILTIVILVSLACKTKNDQKLVKLNYGKDTLVEVMQDLQVAEQAVKTFDYKLQDSIKNRYYTQILEIYNLDSTRLNQDLKNIVSDKDLYLEYQSEVVDSLKAKQKKRNIE